MLDPKRYALGLIKRRLRSRYELDQALLGKGVEAEAREALLLEFEKAGLLDDYRFALAWVHTRDRLSPRGEYLLRQELEQKGIAEVIIRRALQERKAEREEEGERSEFEQAQHLAKSREKLYTGLPREARERRIAAYLQRRGFSYEVIRRILNS